MMKFKLVVFALAVVVFAVSCEKNSDLGPATPTMDNIRGPNMGYTDDIIPGEYIVVFNQLPGNRPAAWEKGIERAKEVTMGVLDEFQVPANNLGYVYAYAIEGFSATLTDDQVSRLQRDSRVNYIEPNQVMSISGSQSNATWGLDRVDLRDLPLNKTYTWDATGTGVNAYILDTGILYSHEEFGGRAKFAFDSFGGDGIDGQGHGTHVAGTVGGAVYGVAKNVSLFGVKVLNDSGSGSVSTVVAGMDWVAAHHKKPAVANMSLGGGGNLTIDLAVENLFNAGVPVIVAAGNSNADASGYSPARAARAYTIGATTSTDARSGYSNFGDHVNLFAPGSSITSAAIASNTATRTMSGTSMASPHVAGGAALFLAHNPNATAQQVYDALTANSTKNIVTSSLTTNNHMLYTLGFGDGSQAPPPTDNQDPVAEFTFTTDGLTANFDASKSYDPDGSIQSYAWNFGDGNTGFRVNTSHTYAAAGTYNVTLMVTDNDGAKNSKTRSVTVSAPETDPEPTNPPSENQDPVADFTFTTDGLTAYFDASESYDPDGSIKGYSWDFGDGSTGFSVTTSRNYAAAGTYKVTLMVTDNDGAKDLTSRSVTVTVPETEPEPTDPPPANQDPVADFTFTTDGLTANFDASKSYDPDGSIKGYAWDFGDGSTGYSVTTSHNYGAAGTYNVTLMVTDNDGAKNSTTRSVTVTAPATDPEPEDSPPVIGTFNFTTRTTGPWSRTNVDWSVSDVDGDLRSVVVEVLNGSSVVDSVTTSVSGSSASGNTELRSRSNTSAVRLTVTDSKGNITSDTKSIN